MAVLAEYPIPTAAYAPNPLIDGSNIVDGSITNADINAAAAIAKTKLAALGIVNADVAGGAAIAGTKLDLSAVAQLVASNTYIAAASGTGFDTYLGAKAPAVQAAGMAMGAALDVNLYREAADILATDDKLHVNGELELEGPLNHDGTTVGLYGVAPVARAAAITPVVTTAAATLQYGYTQAQADSIPTRINAIITALQNVGITL